MYLQICWTFCFFFFFFQIKRFVMESAKSLHDFHRTLINHSFRYFLSKKQSPIGKHDFSDRNMLFEFNILNCNFVYQANVKGNKSCIQSRLNFDSSLGINCGDELQLFTPANTKMWNSESSLLFNFVLLFNVSCNNVLKIYQMHFVLPLMLLWGDDSYLKMHL